MAVPVEGQQPSLDICVCCAGLDGTAAGFDWRLLSSYTKSQTDRMAVADTHLRGLLTTTPRLTKVPETEAQDSIRLRQGAKLYLYPGGLRSKACNSSRPTVAHCFAPAGTRDTKFLSLGGVFPGAAIIIVRAFAHRRLPAPWAARGTFSPLLQPSGARWVPRRVLGTVAGQRELV